MLKEIKRINKKSFANLLALYYGFIGLVMAIITAISTIINIIINSDFQGSIILVVLFNIGAGLLLGVLTSLVMALIGWLLGFIGAAIYNWFSKKIGGIKIDLEDVNDQNNQPQL